MRAQKEHPFMAERDSKDPNGQPRAKPPTPARSVEEQLDEALADSFPASDPVSFVTSQTEEDWADPPKGGDTPKAR
jgi:hypothetical protein